MNRAEILAAAQSRLEAGDLAGADEMLAGAIADRPDDPALRFARGTALLHLRRIDEARSEFRAAVERDPDFVPAWNNLAALEHGAGRLHEAERCCREAIARKPDYADPHVNLGKVLWARGEPEEAARRIRRAIEIDPGNGATWTNLLLALNYREDLGPEEILAEHRLWARRFVSGSPASPEPGDRDPDRRLRVGFVSADFRRHSVAFFFEPLLAHLDREAFEVVAYGNVRPEHEDEVTGRIRAGADLYRTIAGVPDEVVADRIREDAIDVLVDLGGHTTSNRLLVFARRPAPVQTAWLGYLATTGLDAMDWRIVDDITDPPGAGAWHSERLLRLADGFLCYAPPPDAPAVAPLPAEKKGFVTFGSYNDLTKVTDGVVRLWSEVLRAVPGSRLSLKTRALADPRTCEGLGARFAGLGIGVDRLELRGPTPGLVAHLETYGDLDIGLDTHPYNGVTTTCEALLMGVPVITRVGRAHAGRVGATLLRRVGLSSLATESSERFVAVATRLAADLPRLAGLRRGLRGALLDSPLGDGRSFASRFGDALRRMWRERVGADRPES